MPGLCAHNIAYAYIHRICTASPLFPNGQVEKTFVVNLRTTIKTTTLVKVTIEIWLEGILFNEMFEFQLVEKVAYGALL